MKHLPLGRSGFMVSELALGTLTFGGQGCRGADPGVSRELIGFVGAAAAAHSTPALTTYNAAVHGRANDFAYILPSDKCESGRVADAFVALAVHLPCKPRLTPRPHNNKYQDHRDKQCDQ